MIELFPGVKSATPITEWSREDIELLLSSTSSTAVQRMARVYPVFFEAGAIRVSVYDYSALEKLVHGIHTLRGV